MFSSSPSARLSWVGFRSSGLSSFSTELLVINKANLIVGTPTGTLFYSRASLLRSTSPSAGLNTSIIKQNGKIWRVHRVLDGTHAGLHWFRQDAATGALGKEGIIGDNASDDYDGCISVNLGPEGLASRSIS